MYPFTWHRPRTLAEAVALLAEHEDARPIAGGQTLIPVLRQRLANPGILIDLEMIPGLQGIRQEDSALIIGAMTRHAEVAESAVVQRLCPALAALAAVIGDRQVRNRGTVGGSIANHDPAADWPAAALGLGAEMITDRRMIAADRFFSGLFETVLEPDEIVTALRLPLPRRAGYARFPNPASRYALVGVWVAETDSGVRVAVTGAGAGVFRCQKMEAALIRGFDSTALEGMTIEASGLNSDLHAAADYRAHLIGVLGRRAVDIAVGGG
ncbi:aerobic carbon-monoxide dehydrogenase medium subunit [uncultured Gammaproteobacteria bacterium]